MNTLNRAIDLVTRYGVLFSGIAVVLLTVVSKELTGSVMLEIFGFGMLAILIANIALATYTRKRYVDTDAQGAYAVQSSTILGAFIFVGLAIIGIYYMRSDGATKIPAGVQQEFVSPTNQNHQDTSRNQGSNGQQ